MLSICFALALYWARVTITQSMYFAFLVWNLFLAAVPYFVSQWLVDRSEIKTIPSPLFYSGFSLWLLFLPNSPYIITDLVHLHDDSATLIWLDMFLIFVFAINGLLLGLLSLWDMASVMHLRYPPRLTSLLLFLTCMLSGYGIYLGRFLRFNSWDVLTKPGVLFTEVLLSLNQPKVWLITLAFGGFLWILFQLLRSAKGAVQRQL